MKKLVSCTFNYFLYNMQSVSSLADMFLLLLLVRSNDKSP
jgi:hypothetical protein